jgi:hypothetical protein
MKLSPKRIAGFAAKAVIGAVVLAFLGLHSINFFMFTFPVEQSYYAWLGFGLTGGGLVGYLIVFLWEADTALKNFVSFAMVIICGIGEVLAALFGMQIESWKKAGFALTEQDFNTMLLVVGILAFIHFFALVAYLAGEKVIVLFGDEDGDGIKNYRDKDYKKNKGTAPAPVYAQTSQQPAPQHSLDEFLQVAGLTREQARAQYADRDAFMGFASGKFDYISGGNMKRIHGELMGTGNGANPQVGQRR